MNYDVKLFYGTLFCGSSRTRTYSARRQWCYRPPQLSNFGVLPCLLVRPAGFEPATFSLKVRSSTPELRANLVRKVGIEPTWLVFQTSALTNSATNAYFYWLIKFWGYRQKETIFFAFNHSATSQNLEKAGFEPARTFVRRIPK